MNSISAEPIKIAASGPSRDPPRGQEQIPLIAESAIQLDFGKMNGLLPAVVQHHLTKEVLMVGFMNQDAWNLTLAKGLVTFWSRDRQTLWTKGETSGNVLRVKAIATDCDNDTLLIFADPTGPVCHTGRPACFFNEIDLSGQLVRRA
jgi:phosphoribosyl-AMP cyclohydrolase / phosphoribosyl-ATP pyrophosphohydrolase